MLLKTFSFCTKAVYNPKAFVLHAALLDQTFVHCPKFPTAASRRSLDRVSVPVWLVVLSDQLQIAGLVSFYLTNNLI
uniref:Ribokinase n=1 Tax=uncultured bacterium A1Q1_fos_4 TaxID=1256574 RepID=L7VWG0_9BACT|nr:ribokinase [uncultured bacterium A1Q1_fos_4]